MELSNYDFNGLIELRNKVDAEIKRREQDEKAKAKKQILELARVHNLVVEDFLGKSAPSAVRKPVEAKYRHPGNPELTWTGRGRTPVWVQEQLSAGKTLQDLRI